MLAVVENRKKIGLTQVSKDDVGRRCARVFAQPESHCDRGRYQIEFSYRRKVDEYDAAGFLGYPFADRDC